MLSKPLLIVTMVLAPRLVRSSIDLFLALVLVHALCEDEVPVLLDVGHQAPLLEDAGHRGRQGWERQGDALGPVDDLAAGEVQLEVVPLVDAVRVHDDGGEADVNAVPVEDAGEGLREHRARPAHLDHDGGVLAGTPLPEVPAADDEVPRLGVGCEVRAGVLQRMFRELGQVRAQVVVPPRGDEVRGDVVPELPRAPHQATSRGSVITPYIAVAAAVAGLARYVKAIGLPIRPT